MGATLLRFLLRIAAVFYSLSVCLRNFLYSKRLLRVHTVDAVVISIGNITTGGTGKTPLVVWLANFLTQNSKLKTQNCSVLTRGYKASKKSEFRPPDSRLRTPDYNDEPAVFAENCPNVKVIVSADRFAAARQAITEHDARVLIMDDGFQHRRLHRDLDIVTIDATCPFGYNRLLPAGLLREPLSALCRADAVVLTHCDQVSQTQLNQIESRISTVNPRILLARSIHAPVFAGITDGSRIDLDQLKHKRVFALCGIGNPEAFLRTIQHIGADVVGSAIYNDHHHYTDLCVTEIVRQAGNANADFILTTQKDWTKIRSLLPAHHTVPFAYLAIQIAFLAGEDRLKRLIEDAIASRIARA